MGMRLSSSEQEQLVLENQKLVFHVVKKFKVPASDFDEIVSIGYIGLVKAAATFNKSKSASFSTYACRCIENEILMYFRHEKKFANDVSLEDLVSVDKEGNELTFSDIIHNYSRDFVEEIAERDIVERFISIILNILKSRERLIMLYEIAGMTQESIAKILNISRSYVSRIEMMTRNYVKSYCIIPQQFYVFFKMETEGDLYKISFSSKDVNHFNRIFAIFLQNLTSDVTLTDFKVVCNKERVIIYVPAQLESLSLIAQIIKAIDDYSV